MEKFRIVERCYYDNGEIKFYPQKEEAISLSMFIFKDMVSVGFSNLDQARHFIDKWKVGQYRTSSSRDLEIYHSYTL